MTVVKESTGRHRKREQLTMPILEVTEDHTANIYRLGQQFPGTSWILFPSLMSQSKTSQIYLFKENGPSFSTTKVAFYVSPPPFLSRFQFKKKNHCPNNYFYTF